jgi:Endonuclease NucS
MTKLYKISGNELTPVSHGQLANEDIIEGWVARQPNLLGLDILIIGRQVQTDFGGRVDLLGLDVEGNLVLIELKRDRTPREIVAQVLDYASWVAGLKTPQVHEFAKSYLGQPLDTAFRHRFDSALPDTLNSNHTLVIVASAFDASSQRIVRYLAEVHDIAINTAFFTVFADGAETLLTTDWLMDQAEVVERSETRTKAPWSGVWYVNAGEGENRAWDDMRRYGFIAAGGGTTWSGPLTRLQVGDRIVAYQKQAGYVGYGKVTKAAVMARDFETPTGPLLDQPLTQSRLAHDREDPERAEYAVAVDWIRSVPLSEAKWSQGLFANQNIVCKLRDPKTLEFLKHEFGVDNP